MSSRLWSHNLSTDTDSDGSNTQSLYSGYTCFKNLPHYFLFLLRFFVVFPHFFHQQGGLFKQTMVYPVNPTCSLFMIIFSAYLIMCN